MKFELNDLLKDIYSWKNLLKKKDEEIESLQKQLSYSNKQNEALENSRLSLFHEVKELNIAVSMLRNSFWKLEDFEADRKLLLEEKQKLKNSLQSLEKVCSDQKKISKQEIEEIKMKNEEEKTRLISEITNETSRKFESLKNILEEKENSITELKEQLTKLQNEKDQDTLKIRIQYEERIGKLKQQIPKSKVQSVHGLQVHDIFRQKYLKLEKESGEEILKLKEQIKSLQLLNETLKHKSECSSLSSVLLTKQNIYVSTEVPKEKAECASLPQCLKDVTNENTEENYFSVKKRNFNKTETMLPQKRKLFNLNQNYFVK